MKNNTNFGNRFNYFQYCEKERQYIFLYTNDILQYIIICKMNLKGKSPQYCQLYQLFSKQSQQFQLHYVGLGQTDTRPKKSNKPLTNQKLKLICIKDLITNNVHKGQYLKLKMIFPPFKVNAIRLLAEDHTGQNCIVVCVYNFDLKGQHSRHYFPVGSIFYIKSPFFKLSLDGTKIIRIDDPQQIIFHDNKEAYLLSEQNTQIISEPKKFDKSIQILQKIRLQGIKLMNRHQYVNAYALYSQVLKNCENKDYKIKFLLNKAIVCMKLNLKQQYGQYLDDAVKLDKNNKKILYHKVKQLAMIGRLQQAERIVNQQAFESAIKEQLVKFIKIQLSFKSNQIDWYRALKYHELGQLFHQDIKIDKSPYGRGIFAIKALKAGQIIIVEKPLMSTTEEESNQSAYSNIKYFPMWGTGDNGKAVIKSKLIQMHDLSKQFKQKLGKLSSSYKDLVQKFHISPIKGSQLELQGTASKNWFTLSQLDEFFRETKKCTRIGIYQKISMFNHCCEYNCQVFCLSDTMLVYCTKNVNPGDQLFITYTKCDDLIQRKLNLRHWDIQCCHCIFCSEQEQSLIYGQLITSGESHQMEKIKIKEFLLQNTMSLSALSRLEQFCDIDSISLRFSIKRDTAKVAKMMRRIFPITQDKIIQLIESYAKS